MKRRDCWYRKVCKAKVDCNSCIRFIEMKNLMDSSGIPSNMQIPKTLLPNNDLKAYRRLRTIKNNIVKFVNEGKNLYICSETVGNAKTSWAIKLMLRFFDQVWQGNGLRTRGIFIHVPTLLNQLKDFKHPLPKEYLDDLRNCDLVIWDDIATGFVLSDYDHNQLLSYIDYRVLYGKSNIYTSNIVNKDELVTRLGARLASRVLDISEKIEFVNEDGRGIYG